MLVSNILAQMWISVPMHWHIHLTAACLLRQVKKDKSTDVVRIVLHGQPGKLDGFQCSAPDVHHCYKHKHLRTAFTQLPQSKEGSSPVSTKVNPSTISLAMQCLC